MMMDPGGSRKSSVSDAELFGNGSEEPPIPLKRSISGEGKKRQNQFRTSKNEKEFEVEDTDDVFLEAGCNGGEIKKSGTGRSKSDSVLSGVVLSGSSTNSNGDLESSVHSEESPEVVPREHSLSMSPGKKTEKSSDGSVGEGEENQSIVGPLTAVTSKTNKPGIKRSVSFQDDLLQNRDDKSTESRRKEYRMSSGYGTGSNTSLQSQASTGTISNYKVLARKVEETRGSGLSLMYEGDKNSVRLVRKGGGVQQGNGLSMGRVDQSSGNVDNG
uniref:Uncharacterized protein n=1 Tax=Magallana gigas TaxID=29159 RepID=K1S344_MAGGI